MSKTTAADPAVSAALPHSAAHRRHSRRLHRRGAQACDTASSPTPPARTAPAGPADAQCRGLPSAREHQQRMNQHLAPIKPAPARAPQQPTTPPQAPNRQRNAPERTNPHAPRPDRRPPSPSHHKCCYSPSRRPLPVGQIRVLTHASSHIGGAFPRTRTPTPQELVNDQG